MKNNKLLFSSLFLLIVCTAYSQDYYSGMYLMVNQAEYVSEKKWIEITRNKYQEMIVNSDGFNNCVAYYDEIHKELFFVIERSAQYNNLMKIVLLDSTHIEVYALVNNKWQKSSEIYELLESEKYKYRY